MPIPALKVNPGSAAGRHTGKRLVVATVFNDDGTSRTITLPGRFGWTIIQLAHAGKRGCTPIDRPAPRWCHYIWRLRHEWGINIETQTEPHGGAFPGHHAKYILRSRVEIIEDGAGAHEAAA